MQGLVANMNDLQLDQYKLHLDQSQYDQFDEHMVHILLYIRVTNICFH